MYWVITRYGTTRRRSVASISRSLSALSRAPVNLWPLADPIARGPDNLEVLLGVRRAMHLKSPPRSAGCFGLYSFLFFYFINFGFLFLCRTSDPSAPPPSYMNEATLHLTMCIHFQRRILYLKDICKRNLLCSSVYGSMYRCEVWRPSWRLIIFCICLFFSCNGEILIIAISSPRHALSLAPVFKGRP